jgi:hypothetical protein
MSQEETIIMQEAGVTKHDSESPPSFGLKAGAFADVGTLILTNRRLVYVAKGGSSRAAAWALGGALAAKAVEKRVSKAEIDELAQYPGSHSIPLQEVRDVKPGRKMGSSYIRVDNNTPGLKPVYSYVFSSGSVNESWANAIVVAKTKLNSSAEAPNSYTQITPPQTTPVTPAAQTLQFYCSNCGKPYQLGANFCEHCGSKIA